MKKLLASQGWDDDKTAKTIHFIQAFSADTDAESLASEQAFSDFGVENQDELILLYALKLTIDPASVQKDDIEGLRGSGLDDLAIHDLCAIVSYFNFVNRIADGLGVELESEQHG